MNLYDLNEQTYKKLRYGVKVSESVGQHKITVQFVDWEHPLENDFYIAEEVTININVRIWYCTSTASLLLSSS